MLAVIGGGAMEFVHNLAHAADDSVEDRLAMLDVLRAHHIGGVQAAHTDAAARSGDQRVDQSVPKADTHRGDHHHDESNCQLHAQLHLPIVTGNFVLLLVCLGLWVAFLTQLPHEIIRRLHFPRFDGRGPPVAIAL
jgi:hypothetical protein